MRGLFVRILVSFWLAMVVVAAGSFALFELSGPSERWARHRALFDDALQLHAERALEIIHSEGKPEADAYLRTLTERTGIELVVLRGEEVLAGHHRRTGNLEDRVVLDLEGDASAIAWRDRPTAAQRFMGPKPGARLILIAIVAAFLALILARYLTRPLARLRLAAQQLAEGDLDVRVSSRVVGSTSEVVALGADLDRMAKRIASLLESQQRLLRDVSHELRSPVARLQVALGLARRAGEEGDDAKSHLDRIELEAERIGDLIGQILTLSRLEGTLPRNEEVDLGALLETVVADARYEAQALDRSVALESSELGTIRGREDVLRWAIENVLRNAIRYTPAGSQVEVRATRDDRGIEIGIRDHGPGVPEDELVAIFRPFYRIGTDRARRTGGHGVGLAIADHALRVHDGSIRAHNANPGLVVSLRLPT